MYYNIAKSISMFTQNYVTGPSLIICMEFKETQITEFWHLYLYQESH
jgi:hypothetical protein